MPTRTYSRKTAPAGGYADPTKGDPSFTSGVATAIPGRTWRTAASGSDVVLDIDGGDLTGQEDTDLTAAHTAWVPTDHVSFSPRFPVTTSDKGLVIQTDWYATDNGDGTYSDLAMREANTWAGGGNNSVLEATTTTRYAKDGTVLGKPRVETYYTTDDAKRVKKVTYG
jgi:hypothetical protein